MTAVLSGCAVSEIYCSKTKQKEGNIMRRNNIKNQVAGAAV